MNISHLIGTPAYESLSQEIHRCCFCSKRDVFGRPGEAHATMCNYHATQMRKLVYPDKKTRRNRPAIKAENIGAKRKSTKPKVAAKGGGGMSIADQPAIYYGK